MRRAWRETDYSRALEQLQRLADELEHTHPGAAGSLREGMEETLTMIRLEIKGKLRRTLESTNPCESMIDTVRTTQRNVKHRSSGERHQPGGCDHSHYVTIRHGPSSPKFHGGRGNLPRHGAGVGESRHACCPPPANRGKGRARSLGAQVPGPGIRQSAPRACPRAANRRIDTEVSTNRPRLLRPHAAAATRADVYGQVDSAALIWPARETEAADSEPAGRRCGSSGRDVRSR